jgi:hypothetical protein
LMERHENRSRDEDPPFSVSASTRDIAQFP